MTASGTNGAVHWEQDADGVVTATLDDPGKRGNMISNRHVAGLDALLDDLEANLSTVRGLVITSAKASFFSGPDFVVAEMADEGGTIYDHLVPVRNQLRRLETLGRPVAAAITGSALGGGVEITLACHYRVGIADPDTVWALAETSMGLIPAGGGLVRATRMFGIEATVLDIVGPGSVYRPEEALRVGLVDELAATREEVVAAARAWVLSRDPERPAVQRWEEADYTIPGGTVAPEGLADEVRRRVEGTPLAALPAVLEVATVAAAEPVDEVFPIETQAFMPLLTLPVTARLGGVFFGLKMITDGGSRPAAPAAEQDDDRVSLHRFPQVGDGVLASIFFPEGAPVVEILGTPDAPDAAVARAYDQVVAEGGIPIVTRGTGAPFIKRLLDARDGGTAAIAAAARGAIEDGLQIAPGDAGVASVIAAGLPSWTGGALADGEPAAL